MLKLEPSLAARITDSRRIVDFRNLLIHGYAKISHPVVWGIVESNLPTIYREVNQLLEESSES